jgi:starch synthase
MDKIKVILASSEVAPFAKTGGLADVAGSLPKALKKLGADIRVVMPKYKCIPRNFVDKMELVAHFYVHVTWRCQYCGVYKLEYEDITYYFIDNEYYFYRDGLYGYQDEAERFVYFCRALIEMLPVLGFKPDIIHCNDWQTALVGIFLDSDYREREFYKDIGTLFTIHNIKYQGIFPKEIMDELLGLSWEYFHLNSIEHNDQVNMMKAGIRYSDIINTVSRTYAEEIKYDFFGEGLSGIINNRSEDVYGIINGIDYDKNNPETDDRIFENFSAKNPAGKRVNKRMLQEHLGLPVREDVPIVAVISRLVDQKGFDLIDCVLLDILEEDIQFVILGTGENRYENMFRWAAEVYPHKVSSNITFNQVLSQRIYAGADIFLMPSLSEPCGLSQIFSMRYGTIPVVRETGGLNDTVQSYNEFTGEGTGFTFKNYNAHDMLFTLRRAIHFYHDRPVWDNLVKRAMEQDFRWDKSAKEYMRLYKKVLCKEKT